MAGKTMQAFCYESYRGGASALKKVEIPIPTPKKGEILIKVEASSINPADWKLQKVGMNPFAPKLPCVPLYDVAGEVVNVGTGVHNFKPGDKVLSFLNLSKAGGLAEYTVALASQSGKRPPEVSPTDAAGIPIAASTALQSLKLLGVKFDGTGKPSNILITAASGGVGSYTVQLAKLGNLHVTATCGARNVDLVKSLGADEVLDYKTPEGASLTSPSGKKYDGVVDCTEGIAWNVFEKNLSKNAKVIELMPSFGVIMHSVFRKVTFQSKQIVTFFASGNTEDLEFLVGLDRDGKLKTVIDSKHPFENARDAWSKSMEGHATGKIVIEM